MTKTTTIDTAAYDYERTKIRGKDGKVRHSASNGDAIAKAMLVYVAGGGDLEKVARANKISDKIDAKKYDNMGLYRMALGNSLRALVRNGTHVTIGATIVKSLEQRVAVPDDVSTDKKATPRKRKAAAQVAEAA